MLKKHEMESAVEISDPRALELYSEMIASGASMQDVATNIAVMDTQLGAQKGVEEQVLSLNDKKSTLQKTIDETLLNVERYQKIVSKKDRILQYVEEEKKEKENLAELRAAHDQISKEISDTNGKLNNAATVETQIAKLNTVIKTQEQTRQHKLQVANKSLIAAEALAGQLDGLPCKGDGVYSGCKLIENAVTAKNSVPGLKAEIESLEKPLDLPETAEVTRLTAEIADVPELKAQLSTANVSAEEKKSAINGLESKLVTLAGLDRERAQDS